MKRVVGLCVAGLLACGPAVDDPASTGTEGGSSGATTGSLISVGATTSGDSVSSITSTTASTSPPRTSTTTSPSTTTTASTSEGGSTGPMGGSTTSGSCVVSGEYRAESLIGALDRIVIFRTDEASCLRLTLASPMDGSQFGVESTPPWGLEHALASADAEACELGGWEMEGFAIIPDAVGTIDVNNDDRGRPCTLSVDVALQSRDNPAPPVYGDFCHQEISIDGCEL